MNKTRIDWADSNWNPVTGCLHGCNYCYARSIACRFKGFEPRCGGEEISDDIKLYGKNSIWNTTHNEKIHVFSTQPMKRTKSGGWQKAAYPYGFEPTFHRYKLGEYTNKKSRTVFVVSMGDLFGEFIPDEWIKSVFEACAKAPQHRYLFLTKNPGRYIELVEKSLLPIGDNYWYGMTVNTTADLISLYCDHYLAALTGYNRFLSVEPLLGEIMGEINGAALENLSKFDWVIVGAESGNRKDLVVPKRNWVDAIAQSCKRAGTPLFMKNSLFGIMGGKIKQEFPWQV